MHASVYTDLVGNHHNEYKHEMKALRIEMDIHMNIIKIIVQNQKVTT